MSTGLVVIGVRPHQLFIKRRTDSHLETCS
jgi:hypothetical protein